MISMLRMTVLTVGFVGTTLALIWTLGVPPEDDGPKADTVTRSAPSPLSLAPAQDAVDPARAITPPNPTRLVQGIAATSRVRPEARPQVFQVAVRATAPAPAAQPLAPVPAAPRVVAAPSATPDRGTADTGADPLRSMSLGILHDLQRPVGATDIARPKPVPTAAPRAATPAPRNPTPVAANVAPQTKTYTVKDGDSLPGIAFRFFGTTAAYLQILEANRDVLSDPGALEAGMTLRIPDA